MSVDHNLLEIVACPLCKGKLHYDKVNNELVCKFDRLAYPIKDSIPVLLADEAREMSASELPQ
ncbi:Trm112 family protein [Agarivorans sp. MS3-6]|uniref:Trm112 family protein n=1 Tax=Agarivorans sp. TSD2052 TaxID=2937286 RepID=UPI00200EE7BA|nr:Trm112 family protein [Agarivorans sp. TSD2052]UPW16838.1 Trm112 family protein [Agarivorans sp. TSD2052]